MELPSFVRNPFKARRIDEPAMKGLSPLMAMGFVDAWLKDVDTEEVVDHRRMPNTVVDAGEIWMTELLGNEDVDGGALPAWLDDGLQYIAVGKSGTAITQNDYDLGDITTITTCSIAIDTKDISPDNVLTVAATFAEAEGNGALQEAGIFARDRDDFVPASETDHTTNRMFNRTTFGTITKSTSFTLTLQWTITVGALTPP